VVFDIKRYAINDGPGIRVAIFFKGCNLHCAWCHNPEGISPRMEKMYTRSRCIGCGTCVSVCPERAITLTVHGIRTDAGRCKLCSRCADACPSKAVELSGIAMSVGQIMEIIEKERVFFEQSGGGVTFSGGEPLLQSGFLTDLLDACGRQGIHRAVDTAGNVNTGLLLEIAARTDIFLFDLKMMDPVLHEKWTGVGNDLILANLCTLAASGARIIIRIPLIGGVNDSEENIRKTAEFIAGLQCKPKEVNLLPYHAVAQNKYLKLGRPEAFELFQTPDDDTRARSIAIFSEYGITASTGG